MKQGGRRPGAGRKTRVVGSKATYGVTLKFTPAEEQAIKQVLPSHVGVARFLGDVIIKALFRRCKVCRQVAYRSDGRPLYGGVDHVCYAELNPQTSSPRP